jgi:hypothetical protein
MREQNFETAPEKRGLLSPNGILVAFRGFFPFALRSRRVLAASRRAVCEKIDTPGWENVRMSGMKRMAKPSPCLLPQLGGTTVVASGASKSPQSSPSVAPRGLYRKGSHETASDSPCGYDRESALQNPYSPIAATRQRFDLARGPQAVCDQWTRASSDEASGRSSPPPTASRSRPDR